MIFTSAARFLARFFEVLSYVFTALLWLWLAVLLLPLLERSGTLELLVPVTHQPTHTTVTAEPASPFLLLVAAFITAFMIIISIIALWRLPKNLAKAGSDVSHTVAEAVLPAITHHKKLPKKRQRVISQRIKLYVRLALITLPFIAVLFCPPVEELDAPLAPLVAAGLAFVAIVSLLLEQIARHYKLAKHAK